MRITPDELKQAYRNMSDDELMSLDRDDLTDVAIKIHDEELQRQQGLTFRNRPHDAPWSRDRYEGLCRYGPSLFTGAPAALQRSEALRAAKYLGR